MAVFELWGTIKNSYGVTHNLQFRVTEKSQSISENKSSLQIQCWANAVGGSTWVEGTYNGTLLVNGYAYGFSVWLPRTGWVTLVDNTDWWAHASDGTRKISVAYDGSSPYISLVSNLSGSFYITTIPRTSTLSISSSQPVTTLGSPIGFNINRQSSSFTDTLEVWSKSTGSWVLLETIVSKTTSLAVAWIPPITYASRHPNTTTVPLTITLRTYNGTTQIGSNDTVINPTIPDDVIPTMQNITVSDNMGYATTIGAYIKSYSTLNVGGLSSASGIYGSTIKSWNIRVGDKTIEVLSSGSTNIAVSSAGQLTVGVVAVDSRGRRSAEALLSGGINVLDYSPPVINKNIKTFAVRSTALNVPNQLATKIHVSVDSTITTLNVSGQKNKRTITLQAKSYDASEYPSTGIVTIANNVNIAGGTEQKQLLVSSASGFTSFDVSTTYTLLITVSDVITSTSIPIDVLSSKVALSLGKDGIGVGKIWSRGSMDVVGPSYFKGPINVDGTVMATDIISTTPTSGFFTVTVTTLTAWQQIYYQTIPIPTAVKAPAGQTYLYSLYKPNNAQYWFGGLNNSGTHLVFFSAASLSGTAEMCWQRIL